MTAIKVLPVGRLHARHDPGKGNLPRLDRKVDVIVHAAVRQHPERELLPIESQPAQITRPIRVVPENVSPLVAPNDHVVQPTNHRHRNGRAIRQ
jgi:hypothetical protein